MDDIKEIKPIDQSWNIDDKSENLISNQISVSNNQIPINNQSTDQTENLSDLSSDIVANQQIPIKNHEEIALSEEEPTQHPPIWKTILKAIGVFVGVFVFVYLFLTFPAQYAKMKYWFKHFGKKDTPQTIELPTNINDSSDLLLSTLKNALDSEKPVMQEEVQQIKYSISIADLENNTLIVPKLDVKAPITWNSPPDDDVMLKNLQNGVVHYNGTGLPNEQDGNVFISGHSSYYWWDKGGYKTVFANLNELENGDEIALAYEDKVYIYRVYEKIEVNPNEVEVVKPIGKPILTLMTCVPVGTNLRRLIVKSERIAADAKNVKIQTTTETVETKTQAPIASSTPTITPVSSPTTIFNDSGINPLDILNILPWR